MDCEWGHNVPKSMVSLSYIHCEWGHSVPKPMVSPSYIHKRQYNEKHSFLCIPLASGQEIGGIYNTHVGNIANKYLLYMWLMPQILGLGSFVFFPCVDQCYTCVKGMAIPVETSKCYLVETQWIAHMKVWKSGRQYVTQT